MFSACPIDPVDTDCPPFCPGDSSDTIIDQLPYELIWQTPLFEDTLYSISKMNNIYNNGFFIASKRKGPSFNEIVIAFDGRTGQKLWEWDDYLDNASNYFKCRAYVANDVLYESSTHEVHAINLLNGKTIFKTVEYDYIPSTKISFTSKHLYHTYDFTILDNPESKLMVHNPEENIWEVEFKIGKVDDFGVSLSVPTSNYTNEGDTILYFANRMYKTEGDEARVDFIAYNISADSIFWVKEKIDTSAYAIPNSQNQPIIEGDCIYLFLNVY